MIIIGISGKKGSGKTTVSESIKEFFPSDEYEVVELKFAAVLYEIHDKLRNIMRSYGVDVNGSKDRVLLQWIGTEWGRESFYEDVWVDIVSNKIGSLEKIGNKEKVYVLDDLRFPNEFKMLQNMGAVTIRLECPANVRASRAESYQGITSRPEGFLQNLIFFLSGGTYPKAKEHISETALDHMVDDFDFAVNTDRLNVTQVKKSIKDNLDLLKFSNTLRNQNLNLNANQMEELDNYEQH